MESASSHDRKVSVVRSNEPPLLNCPKCRTPLAPHIQLCCSCGVKVAEMPSVDRPGTCAPRRSSAPPR